MRIALISDIHGNTVALDAVLADLGERPVDLLVCLGDIAANGPDPAGAVERIAERAQVTVMGNTDEEIVDVPDWWHDPALLGIPEAGWPGIQIGVWNAEQLTGDHLAFLAGLPATAELELGGLGTLLAFHGSPRSPNELITADTDPDQLGQMLGDTDHRLLAGGHTHVPLVRRHGTSTILNPGSVGRPFATYGYAGAVEVHDRAEYAVVTTSGSGCRIELRQVRFDLDHLARQVRSTGMPHGDWWLGLW